MAPYAHGDVRSLAVEREWDGWDDFFKSGSLLLASVCTYLPLLHKQRRLRVAGQGAVCCLICLSTHRDTQILQSCQH